ncbi:hypothetical protein [Terrabacter sp. NPDC080008]|uniref:hypothetical protein n=1 Tax=Terrabacter sp. NPDC080008 TaxID=3155176 RepID=UPI00344E906E
MCSDSDRTPYIPSEAGVVGGWYALSADGPTHAADESRPTADDGGLFLDEESTDAREATQEPAAGTGVVWIIRVGGESADEMSGSEAGPWHASWQGEGNEHVTFDGERAAVIEWARARGAAKIMISEAGAQHIPLD